MKAAWIMDIMIMVFAALPAKLLIRMTFNLSSTIRAFFHNPFLTSVIIVIRIAIKLFASGPPLIMTILTC